MRKRNVDNMDKKGISRAGIVGIIVVVVIVAAGAGYFLLGGGPSEGENPIKIGVIGPMKQMTGKQQKWGAQLAIKQINNQGGSARKTPKNGYC